MDIVEALAQLDVNKDEDWTEDGLPSVDAVAALVEDEVTRAQIVDAAPEFNRQAAADAVAKPPADPETKDEEEAEPGLEPHQVYEAKMAELEQELAGVAKELAVLNDKRKELETAIHAASVMADRLRPADAGQQNISNYLARQKQIAKDRGEVNRQLRESGVASLLKGAGKAPIDAAMNQRKPARGSQRPVRPQ